LESQNPIDVVVISGITGTKLQEIAQGMLREAEHRYRLINVEKILEKELGVALIDILDTMVRSPSIYKATLSRAIDKVLNDVLRSEGNAIVTMHLSYLRRKHTMLNPTLLKLLSTPSIRIKAIVLIVEDYYHALNRIVDRIVSRSLYIEDTLDPLLYLNWRAYDFGVAMSLLYQGLRVLLFGAKHRIETYRRLARYVLDSEDMKLVYFAHHIRMLRRKSANERIPLSDVEEVKEIEEFKTMLIERCPRLILFEPTTVDELILDKDNELSVQITRENRWPHNYETMHRDYGYPIDMRSSRFSHIYDTDLLEERYYLKNLTETIKTQIVTRDLFYVNQSDAVLAYRPTMHGQLSHGMTIEFTVASAQAKPVFVYVEQDNEYVRLREMFTEFMFRRIKDREQLLRSLMCIE